MPDSTVSNLPLLSNPEGADLIPTGDVSAGGVLKRMPLDKAMQYILDNEAFTALGGALKLNAAQNCNAHKLINLAPGTADADALNYSQLKAWIGALDTTPGITSISDRGAFLRLVVSSVTNPPGGLYMFYWCVDGNANTQITLSGGTPVASSGATIYFEGSVANVANVVKDGGWQSKHFHCACAYRNLNNITSLGPTGHLQISSPAFPDIIATDDPDPVKNASLGCKSNRLVLLAKPIPEAFAVQYLAEILVDDKEYNEIMGNEPALIRIGSPLPDFSWDLTLAQTTSLYAHARILTVSPTGKTAVTDTLHVPISFDSDALSDHLLNYLAARVSEKVVTASGEYLKIK